MSVNKRFKLPLIAAAAAFSCVFARAAGDPTRMSAAMGDVLKAQLAEFRSIGVPGLVCDTSTNGVALVRTGGEDVLRVVRTGTKLTLKAGGIPFPVTVTSVTENGVTVKADTLDNVWTIPVAFARTGGICGRTNTLAYVQFDGIPLRAALRLLSDRTGRNFAATEAAAEKKVSLFFRDAAADATVDELCKSHGLWSRTDDRTGVTRILTLEEFQKNIAGFQQEEQCETFTLLYPNVTEVASIIQGVYADRVYLTLGDQDILDDELDDLSRRFERYSVVADTASSSDLMGSFSSSMNGMRGSYGRGRGRGGVYSSSGGWMMRNGRWQTEQREQEREMRTLGAQDAERIGRVLDANATNAAAVARGLLPFRNQAPSIYVTVSRRSNILVVRTADPRVMEDIRALVKRVDVPTPMVLLEVEVMELRLDDGLNTVFDYDFNSLLRKHQQVSVDGASDFNPLAPRTITFSILSERFNARLKAERERGRVKTLATPVLLTAHNEVSQLFIGEEIPVAKNVTSTTVMNKEGGTVTTPLTETEWEKVGVRLLITPNINADRTVTLRLMQENSEIDEDRKGRVYAAMQYEVKSFDVDLVKVRSVSGTFVAQDRMTVVAGGLVSESVQDVQNGIPLLMDLPYLGWFFRSTKKEKLRSELVVYITPHVLSTPAEAGVVTSRFTNGKVRSPYADRYRTPEDLLKELKDREEARRSEKKVEILPDVDTFHIK